jgi:hypothetical protein
VSDDDDNNRFIEGLRSTDVAFDAALAFYPAGVMSFARALYERATKLDVQLEVLRALARDVFIRKQCAHCDEWHLCAQCDAIMALHAAINACTPAQPCPPAIHILHGGYPLCAFSRAVPSAWPVGNRWVRVADHADATCDGCRRAFQECDGSLPEQASDSK